MRMYVGLLLMFVAIPLTAAAVAGTAAGLEGGWTWLFIGLGFLACGMATFLSSLWKRPAKKLSAPTKQMAIVQVQRSRIPPPNPYVRTRPPAPWDGYVKNWFETTVNHVEGDAGPGIPHTDKQTTMLPPPPVKPSLVIDKPRLKLVHTDGKRLGAKKKANK